MVVSDYIKAKAPEGRVPKKFEIFKLFHEEDDPGLEFEMSEWFDKSKKTPPTETILLVKLTNGDTFKGVWLGTTGWCTWEDGYAWGGKDITEWAYIRKIDGEDIKEVANWIQIQAKERMSS